MNEKALEFFAKIATPDCSPNTPKLAYNNDYILARNLFYDFANHPRAFLILGQAQV